MSSASAKPPSHAPDTSTLSPGSMRPEFGLTQYCFGAVVLTLKATGDECGLCTSRARFTSWVRGPVSVLFMSRERGGEGGAERNVGKRKAMTAERVTHGESSKYELG